MKSEVFARVVFQSPLPALDREFEYSVPKHLESAITVGCRVSVPFAGQAKEGFVVALSSQVSFTGKISAVSEVISSLPVLQPHIFMLLKAIAERQCCSIGELIENAIPRRSVRVDRGFDFQPFVNAPNSPGRRMAHLIRPHFSETFDAPYYAVKLKELALEYLKSGRSVIICVPDFRDIQRVREVIEGVDLSFEFIIQDSSEVGSKRYEAFLRQLTDSPKLVLGTRSAIYSPLPGDSAILVWDDGDQSHQDQQSPYLTTREIALIRQSLFGGPIHFLGHARSTEVQRLVEIGYLEEDSIDSWRPQIGVSEGRGLDAIAFKTIKSGLETGSVLVQVAAPGVARSLYCQTCSDRSGCSHCNGPLWLNSKRQIVCRWCGQFNLDFLCSNCGGKELKQGAAGATRWVEQLGKSFPGVAIREITAERPTEQLSSKPSIVVATAGIEPKVHKGYSAVVFIDCAAQLSRDTLRAPEDALRSWLNALGYMRQDGRAVAVGVSDEVSKALTLGLVVETVSAMLSERELLGFPPARRIVSITGALETLNRIVDHLKDIDGLKVLGIAEANTNTTSKDYRLVATFTYAAGAIVSKTLRQFLLTLGTKDVRTSYKSGRTLRPVTIKFDDPRVL